MIKNSGYIEKAEIALNEAVKTALDAKEPVVVTRDGEPLFVVVDYATYRKELGHGIDKKLEKKITSDYSSTFAELAK